MREAWSELLVMLTEKRRAGGCVRAFSPTPDPVGDLGEQGQRGVGDRAEATRVSTPSAQLTG